MAAPDQFVTEFQIIVNLAVEDDPPGPVFVGNWLIAGLQVNDLQAPRAQSDVVLDPKAIGIGTAMRNGIVHLAQHTRINGMLRVCPNDPANATHYLVPLTLTGTSRT
jgi:hypothetical protein